MQWLAADESARIAAVQAYHMRSRTHDEPEAGYKLHAAAHCMAESPIALERPPEARRTLARLIDQGLSRHEAIHALGSALFGWFFDLAQQNRPVVTAELEEYLRRLDAQTWWDQADESADPDSGSERERDVDQGSFDSAHHRLRPNAGVQKPVIGPAKPGRNETCWCGSGKKYKKCHLNPDELTTAKVVQRPFSKQPTHDR